MQSAERVLRHRKGTLPGQPTICLFAVATIVLLQSMDVAGGGLSSARPLWALPSFATAALAAALGLAAARARGDAGWRRFASDQLRRAVPVYLAAILLAAFALGPLVTSERAASYIGDNLTWRYLLNLVGWPQLELPGVFEFNDLTGILNRNVWAAPIALVVGAVAGISPGRRWLRALPLVLTVVIAIGSVLASGLELIPDDALGAAPLLLRGPALGALVAGLLGVAAYRERQWVPVSGRLAIVSAVMLVGIALGGNAGWAAAPPFQVAGAVAVTYLALFLSLARLGFALAARRAAPILTGVFLFSFPLQQLAASRGSAGQPLAFNLLAGAGGAVALAALFWLALGRRLLSPRQREVLVEDVAAQPGGTMTLRKLVRIRRQSLLTHIGIGVLFVSLCLGMMALLYIAMSPDPGGM